MTKKDEIRKLMPWNTPGSVHDDDGAVCDVEVQGHRFEIRDSGETGVDSGRTRWRVTCVSCDNVLVHPGSTSATAQIAMHLDRPTERHFTDPLFKRAG
jgi:hypothetical protein